MLTHCDLLLRYVLVRPEEGFERPGIGPPAIKDVVGHGALFNVNVVDIGDFQLAPFRGDQASDDVEDI